MQQIYRSTPISKCDFNKVTKQLYWNHTSAWAIHKTRNTGMGDGMQGTRGMFTRIPGNALILAFRGMFEKIQGNVINDSKKCSRRFRGMLLKIPGNAREDSGEWYERFRGMLEKIPGMFKKIPRNIPEDSGECSSRFRVMFKQISGNVQKDSGECKFRFISWNLICFSPNFAVKLLKNNEMNEQFFYRKHFLHYAL